MKLVAYPLAAVLAALGLMFIVGAQGLPLRIVVGVVLLAAAGALIWLALQQKSETTIVQKIDLSGDVKLEQLICRSCGGTLGKDSVSVRAGGVFVNCQYCGATYQIEEEPKW